MEKRLEASIFPILEPIAEEIIEDAVSSHWHHLSEDETVVILSFHLIGKGVKGFIDSNKFSMSSFVIRVVLGVIFKGKFSVGCFDLFQSCSFWNTQSVIVGVQRIRVVFVEEFLFFLIHG